MKPRIDIAITATLRPHILYRTLAAAREHLLGDWPCRAVINVDPIGEVTSNASEILEIGRAFSDEVLSRTPAEPYYADALKWVFSNCTAPWVLQVMDDNELIRDVSLEDMIATLERFGTLGLLRLPEWDTTSLQDDGMRMRQWQDEVPFDEERGLYWIPRDRATKLGYAGKLSLVRGEFAVGFGNLLDITQPAEKQWRRGSGCNEQKAYVQQWDYAVYAKPGDTRAFKDIGVRWRKEHGFAADRKYLMCRGWRKYE